MNKLPNEITDMICDFADQHYESSKNLRLTARRFYPRATKNVFRTLLVHHHPDSYTKINNIAQSQELSYLVETLYLPREHALYMPLKDQSDHGEDFEQQVERDSDYMPQEDYSFQPGDFEQWAERAVDSWNAGRVKKGGSSAIPPQREPEHDRILREGFARAEYWRQGREEIHTWLVDAYFRREDGLPITQRVRLNQLPRIQTIDCLERLDLVALNRRKYGDDCYGLTRIELETLDGQYAEYEHECYFGQNLNFELFFLEHQRGGSNVKTLKLRDVANLDSPYIDLNLSYLRVLTIDFTNEGKRALEPESRYQNNSVSMPRAVWIPPMADIESLTLVQPQTNVNPSLLNAFNLRRFPKLRELHLKYITTTATTLREFLAAHQSSLERIVIDQPLIEATQWARLKYEIQTLFETKKSTSLVLTNSFKPECSYSASEWPGAERIEGSKTAAKWWSIVGVY